MQLNGEIFEFKDTEVKIGSSTLELKLDTRFANDGLQLFAIFERLSAECASEGLDPPAYLRFMASTLGPLMANNDFTFVYHERRHYGVVIVGSCLFHKRSLVLNVSQRLVSLSSAVVWREEEGNEEHQPWYFETSPDTWIAFKVDAATQEVEGFLGEIQAVSGVTPAQLRFNTESLEQEEKMAASFNESLFIS